MKDKEEKKWTLKKNWMELFGFYGKNSKIEENKYTEKNNQWLQYLVLSGFLILGVIYLGQLNKNIERLSQTIIESHTISCGSGK